MIMRSDNIFRFEETIGGLSLQKFLAADNKNVTKADIPSVHEGLAVLEVGFEAFAGARFLRSVTVPSSVSRLGGGAFRGCAALESICVHGGIRKLSASVFLGCTGLKRAELCEGVEVIGSNAFRNCTALESIAIPKSLRVIESCAFLGSPKLPAETVMMGLAGSVDYTEPFRHYAELDLDSALRDDVFTLALKYGSFRNIDRDKLVTEITRRGTERYLRLAEHAGLFSDAERLDEYISVSAKKGYAEITAWLLEYKKARFGFDGGNRYEL